MDIQNRTEADSIIQAAKETAKPFPITSDVLGIVVPAGSSIQPVDPERYQPAPRRASGTYKPATVLAFLSYFSEHASDSGSTVWVHPTAGLIVGILNDHDPDDGPDWRDHKVVTQLETTPQWTHWLRLDGKMVDQITFAEHIEAALEDIVDPAAADVLELAQTFHARSNVSFRSSNRLASGETKIAYDETTIASAGATGELTIPPHLELSLSPFVGEAPYRVKARFRFRVNGGQLTLGYKLDRPDIIVRDALDTVARTLAEKLPRVYVGDEPA